MMIAYELILVDTYRVNLNDLQRARVKVVDERDNL